MKKIWISLTLFGMLLAGCGSQTAETLQDASRAASIETGSARAETQSETITYQSENGPIEVPAHPKRVISLATFSGHVISLGVNLVGVDTWSKQNPLFSEALKDVEEVSDENLEKIMELEPDLIIGLSTIKNINKLQQIAPTVTYTYGRLDYLTQYLEIGKLLNKEKEARAWIDDFKQRVQKAGEEIRAKIGPDATVSVIESFDKQLYVYGDNWGRGTEILYQEMKLKMPEKIKETALKEGYYAISTEVLPEYAGDYIVFSKWKDTDSSFQQTDTYKNIPAVKNNRVFEANAEEFFLNDPLTLDFQLDFLTKSFLGN